jgi:hypothetical protein
LHLDTMGQLHLFLLKVFLSFWSKNSEAELVIWMSI